MDAFKIKVAKRDLFLDEDGKVTADDTKSRSLFIAAGTQYRPDHLDRMKHEGFEYETASEPEATESAPEAKAVTAPPENKAVKAPKETK